jgi:hypothetical protein
MGLPTDAQGRIAQVGRLGASANIATSATSASQAIADDRCYAVRLVASVDTTVSIGHGAAEASATSTLLVAGSPEYFAATADDVVAARSADAGVLNITEII